MRTSAIKAGRLLGGGSLLLLAVALVLCGRAAMTGSRQRPAPGARMAMPELDVLAAARRLGKALTFATVCNPNEKNLPAFQGLKAHLKESFPLVHEKLERFEPAPPSLLYRWAGKDAAAAPVLLMSHLDVVPVSRDEVGRWTHSPWGGEIAPDRDGVEYVWGRGALDVKCGALGMLEAAELLLADGFLPAVDVYFAFGHDEESGGAEGAALLTARWLAANKLKGKKFQFTLDEGGGIIDGVMPGLAQSLGLVATAEKGYGTVKLSVDMKPGHSSMPPPHTAIGLLAAALARLEENPLPASLSGDNPTGAMLDVVAGDSAWPYKVVFANRDVLAPLLLQRFAQVPALNAVVRTTTSVNVIKGGETENVQPAHAEALVNFRLHPNDTLDGVLQHVRKTVNDDRVQCEFTANARPASPVSSANCDAYRKLEDAIHSLYPAVVVAPGLSVVATDSRHYEEVTEPNRTYRFLPMRLNAKNNDLGRIHGIDERISVENYKEIIQFMVLVLRGA